MPKHRQTPSDCAKEFAKVPVGRIAARQHNRVAAHQLARLGLSSATIHAWTRGGYLHPRLRGVYAVGSPARTIESDLFEAVLYAGPDAMLSHTTGGWWLELIDRPAPLIHVSTPHRRTSPAGIIIHCRRFGLERILHRGVPVTTQTQTVLDLAAIAELRLVRRALTRLDYDGTLHPEALLDICGPGRAGSQALRSAIADYDPRFARTRSPLEEEWLTCCERLNIPKPDAVNVQICGITVDAVYYDAKVIIELDGIDNHRSPAQVRRDHRNDFTLRAAGWLVLRYTSDQVRDDSAAITAEVLNDLASRAGLGASTAAPASR